MSNNFLQFSEHISNITPAEAKWAKERLQEMKDKYDENGEEGWDFEWAIHEKHDPEEGPHIWVYSEEGSSVDHVADFFHEFLTKFRPLGHLSLTWAAWSDKLRPGEFSGGGFLATASGVQWYSPDTLIAEAIEKLKPKKAKKK